MGDVYLESKLFLLKHEFFSDFLFASTEVSKITTKFFSQLIILQVMIAYFPQ